jgi:serine/threonine protein kinase
MFPQLKASLDMSQLNVLIDDSGKAVLCDFGLSRVKADATSRTVTSGGGPVVGSRCWMAPERLLGGSLKKPCDIYAFAMTLYEVSTGRIALKIMNLIRLI